MPNRYSAKIGEAFTLDAQFSLKGVNQNVFELSKVEIQDIDENVVETIDTVIALGSGLYRVTVPALVAGGTLYDVWYYTDVENAEEDIVSFTVEVADTVVASGDVAASTDSTPDAGAGAVCHITGKFFNAGGQYFQGVFVRFTPNQITDQLFSTGMIARETTTQSDVDGNVDFYLMRGVRGTLTISGIGICREVTVPDSGAANLFDLLSGTDDPLEIQTPAFVSLPRSS